MNFDSIQNVSTDQKWILHVFNWQNSKTGEFHYKNNAILHKKCLQLHLTGYVQVLAANVKKYYLEQVQTK